MAHSCRLETRLVGYTDMPRRRDLRTHRLDLEIRERLARFVSGKSGLQAFTRWFVPATWELDASSDPNGAAALANAIKLHLAEHSSGHTSAARPHDVLA